MCAVYSVVVVQSSESVDTQSLQNDASIRSMRSKAIPYVCTCAGESITVTFRPGEESHAAVADRRIARPAHAAIRLMFKVDKCFRSGNSFLFIMVCEGYIRTLNGEYFKRLSTCFELVNNCARAGNNQVQEGSRKRGSAMTKQEPPSGASQTTIVPCCFSTSCLTSARPRPLPPDCLARSLLTV